MLCTLGTTQVLQRLERYIDVLSNLLDPCLHLIERLTSYYLSSQLQVVQYVLMGVDYHILHVVVYQRRMLVVITRCIHGVTQLLDEHLHCKL